MKRTFVPLLVAGLAGSLVAASPLVGDGELTCELDHKPDRRAVVVLPSEKWSELAGLIPVPNDQGDGFRTYPDGVVLMVDADADGHAETKIKGIGGFAVLRGKTADGKRLLYGVRFKKSGKAWQYAAGGAMIGKLGGETIRIIDANNNGTYDDYGEDAIVVGRGKAACYLSKVVNLDGKLYEFSISADGTQASAKPFAGESGRIDLRGGFIGYGKLESVVVRDESGKISFNLLQDDDLLVPTGNYKFAIVGGLVTKSNESAHIGAGRMEPIEVTAGTTAKLEWGGPIVADFTYSVAGDEIKVPPDVHYYGKAGEEYYDWDPDAQSPKILVYDSRKKRPVASGRFTMC